MSRCDRQRAQILAAMERADYRRVLVLSRQHLAEFPDDVDVQEVATRAGGIGDGTQRGRDSAGSEDERR